MRGLHEVVIALIAALLILLALPVFANEPAASGQSTTGSPVLKFQSAVTSTAAAKAMMLDSTLAGKRIVAVGDHGVVLLSDDDGATFRQAKTVPVRSTLTAVCFIDDKTGWAVGHWGVILATGDGGETWKLQRSDTNVDQPLFSVYFKDSKRGWAVGLWSLLLTTRDGGKSWVAEKLPAPPGGGKIDRNLLKIFSSATGTLLIAAEQGMVLRSSDDGAHWSYASTGYKGSFWTGISLKDGTLLVGGLRGTIFRSTNDGISWNNAKSDMSSSITDFGEGNGKVVAVALDGVFLESSDKGITFKGTQRNDRASFTAFTVTNSGKLVTFSKDGVMKDIIK